jgi:hypothetical protein
MGTCNSTDVAAGHAYCGTALGSRGSKHVQARFIRNRRARHSRLSLQMAATGFTAKTYPPIPLFTLQNTRDALAGIVLGVKMVMAL